MAPVSSSRRKKPLSWAYGSTPGLERHIRPYRNGRDLTSHAAQRDGDRPLWADAEKRCASAIPRSISGSTSGSSRSETRTDRAIYREQLVDSRRATRQISGRRLAA